MESTDLQRVNFEEGYVAVIDKPYRCSSTDVVRKVKFELRKAGYRRIKVGHAGTLDPLATGVLLVCIGRATKRVDALQAERKEYIAGVRLGATTPSFDREHTVERTFPTDHITRPEVEMRRSLVTIYDIELLECRLPELTIRVRCSKGTYIRSLAREIGEALSSGAYLTSLRRTRSGTHDVEAAWQLDDFLKKLRGE